MDERATARLFIFVQIKLHKEFQFITSFKSLISGKQKTHNANNACVFFMVGVTGFEPMASWSRTMRATICATPR